MCHTSTVQKRRGNASDPTGSSPLPPPPFTLSDLKKAIPAHCFTRSTSRSLLHLASDICVASVFFLFALWIDSLPSAYAQLVLWPVYWFCQGAVCTGLWVLAHECGHGAFTDHKWLNDCVGSFVHSALLVPYHAWRISHGKHHKWTGDIDNDEVFLPATKDEVDVASRPGRVRILLQAAAMELFGWPLYLATNVTGPRKYRGKTNSHFNPDSVLFSDRERSDVRQSVVLFFAALAGCAYAVYTWGLGAFVRFYLIPLLVVNFWLVTITYLQHTDKSVPHYRGKEWTWIRGALATIDRDYGFLNHVFHRITDTHVAHHLFSYMPFYHAAEATEAIKPILGKYYNFDDTPVLSAIYKSFEECRYVDLDDGDVLYYHQ